MDIVSLVSHPSPTPSEAKPFVCTSKEHGCGKAFARRSDLIRHERIHRNERPFPCDFRSCNKRFIQRSALTVHMRTHTGERPHACEVCARAFSDSSSLARHRRMHTGKRLFRCTFDHCDKAFCRKTTLAKHLRHHIGTADTAELDRLIHQSITRNAMEQQAEEAHRLATAAPPTPLAPGTGTANGRRKVKKTQELAVFAYPTPPPPPSHPPMNGYNGLVTPPFAFPAYRDFAPSSEVYRPLPPHLHPHAHLASHPHFAPHPHQHPTFIHGPQVLDDGSSAYHSPPPSHLLGHPACFPPFESDPYGWQRYQMASYAEAYYAHAPTTATTPTSDHHHPHPHHLVIGPHPGHHCHPGPSGTVSALPSPFLDPSAFTTSPTYTPPSAASETFVGFGREAVTHHHHVEGVRHVVEGVGEGGCEDRGDGGSGEGDGRGLDCSDVDEKVGHHVIGHGHHVDDPEEGNETPEDEADTRERVEQAEGKGKKEVIGLGITGLVMSPSASFASSISASFGSTVSSASSSSLSSLASSVMASSTSRSSVSEASDVARRVVPSVETSGRACDPSREGGARGEEEQAEEEEGQGGGGGEVDGVEKVEGWE